MGSLAVFVAGLLAVLAMAWIGQRRLIYFPERNPGPLPEGVRVLEVVTSDGISHRAWLVSAEGRPSPGWWCSTAMPVTRETASLWPGI